MTYQTTRERRSKTDFDLDHFRKGLIKRSWLIKWHELHFEIGDLSLSGTVVARFSEANEILTHYYATRISRDKKRAAIRKIRQRQSIGLNSICIREMFTMYTDSIPEATDLLQRDLLYMPETLHTTAPFQEINAVYEK